MSSEQFKQPASDSSDTIAMVVEIIFGLFGLLGMGWLYAGNIPVAIGAFLGFAVLVFVEGFIVTVTFGLAACVIIPFNVVIAVVSGLRARDYVRNTGKTGSVVYLALGILVGAAVICGGLFMIFGGLAAFGAALG